MAEANGMSSAKPSRERSTIQFPYGDLDDGVEVATAIHANAGSACAMADLASYMQQTVTSGAFRTKVNTARIFQIVTVARQQVTLTDLGHKIVDPQRQAAARSEAFLKVPLYATLFDRYRGRVMPPESGLEQDMVSLGVASKQRDKARQAFQRSAQQAGFFAHGRDRLTLPIGLTSESSAADGTSEEQEGVHAGVGGTIELLDDHHELIKGLFRMLPTKGPFPRSQRTRWLKAAEVNLDLVYGEDVPSDATGPEVI
ncbi:MAG: hypothetical protein M3273_01840 [Actinomycetota bacterium]|nr:hypothetical protein [Actinomycetota bacterium]